MNQDPPSQNKDYISKQFKYASVRLDDEPYVTPSQDDGSAIQKVPKQLTSRVSSIEALTRTVLVVVCATLVATLVGATAIIMDQLHFNYETQEKRSEELNTEIGDLETRLEITTKELRTTQEELHKLQPTTPAN